MEIGDKNTWLLDKLMKPDFVDELLRAADGIGTVHVYIASIDDDLNMPFKLEELSYFILDFFKQFTEKILKAANSPGGPMTSEDFIKLHKKEIEDTKETYIQKYMPISDSLKRSPKNKSEEFKSNSKHKKESEQFSEIINDHNEFQENTNKDFFKPEEKRRRSNEDKKEQVQDNQKDGTNLSHEEKKEADNENPRNGNPPNPEIAKDEMGENEPNNQPNENEEKKNMEIEDKNIWFLDTLLDPVFINQLIASAADIDDPELFVKNVDDAIWMPFQYNELSPMVQKLFEFLAVHIVIAKSTNKKAEEVIAAHKLKISEVKLAYVAESLQEEKKPIEEEPKRKSEKEENGKDQKEEQEKEIKKEVKKKHAKKKEIKKEENIEDDYVKAKLPDVKSLKVDEVECIAEHKFKIVKDVDKILKQEMEAFVSKKLSKKPIMLPNDSVKEYRLVEDISFIDELGEWKFSPLCEMMNIYVKSKDPTKPLPIRFLLPPEIGATVKFDKMRDEEVKNGEDEEEPDLHAFLESVAKRSQKEKHLAKWWKALKDQHVDTVDELLNWPDSAWWHVKDFTANDIVILKAELKKFNFSRMGKKTKQLTEADETGMLHRIKRYLIWMVDPKKIKEQSLLDASAIEKAFAKISETYKGEHLLNQLEHFYMSYAIKENYSEKICYPRGMILYGPPGTGKSTLTSDLPLMLGLCPVSQALCASDVNRSLVGQTEKLLKELFNRATRVPYLQCCVAIDEIDGLAPKRDEKNSQHKTDALAVLLSCIDGIQNVKNIIILASTNRLDSIDDALKRRLSGQYFVGRPDPEARRAIIEGCKKTLLNDEDIKELVALTTNFSGAALKHLMSAIIEATYVANGKVDEPKKRIDVREIIQLTARISRQFSIKLGNFTLAELVSDWGNDEDKKEGDASKIEKSIAEKLRPKAKVPYNGFTGRILIDMDAKGEQQIEFETNNEKDNPITQELKLPKSQKLNTNMILPLIARFATLRNIDYVSFLDMDMLLSNNAFEDSKIMESIKERRQEILGDYLKTLYVIDVDSLVGVTESSSTSNMGPSTSKSISSHKLFTYIIEEAVKLPKMTKDREIWVALVSRDEFLTREIKLGIDWPKSKKQKSKEKEERMDSIVHTCVRCKEKFTNAKNELTSCNYHPGFLFETSIPPEDWVSLTKNEAERKIAQAIASKKEEPKFQYICCKRSISDVGCTKNKHTNIKKDWEREKIEAQCKGWQAFAELSMPL